MGVKLGLSRQAMTDSGRLTKKKLGEYKELIAHKVAILWNKMRNAELQHIWPDIIRPVT